MSDSEIEKPLSVVSSSFFPSATSSSNDLKVAELKNTSLQVSKQIVASIERDSGYYYLKMGSKRGPSVLGKVQGDHVTSYALVVKGIVGLFEGLTIDQDDSRDEIVERREKLFRYISAIAALYPNPVEKNGLYKKVDEILDEYNERRTVKSHIKFIDELANMLLLNECMNQKIRSMLDGDNIEEDIIEFIKKFTRNGSYFNKLQVEAAIKAVTDLISSSDFKPDDKKSISTKISNILLEKGISYKYLLRETTDKHKINNNSAILDSIADMSRAIMAFYNKIPMTSYPKIEGFKAPDDEGSEVAVSLRFLDGNKNNVSSMRKTITDLQDRLEGDDLESSEGKKLTDKLNETVEEKKLYDEIARLKNLKRKRGNNYDLILKKIEKVKVKHNEAKNATFISVRLKEKGQNKTELKGTELIGLKSKLEKVNQDIIDCKQELEQHELKLNEFYSNKRNRRIVQLFYYPRIPDDKLAAHIKEMEDEKKKKKSKFIKTAQPRKNDNEPNNLMELMARHLYIVFSVYLKYNNNFDDILDYFVKTVIGNSWDCYVEKTEEIKLFIRERIKELNELADSDTHKYEKSSGYLSRRSSGEGDSLGGDEEYGTTALLKL